MALVFAARLGFPGARGRDRLGRAFTYRPMGGELPAGAILGVVHETEIRIAPRDQRPPGVGSSDRGAAGA